MKPQDILNKLEMLEKRVVKSRQNDVKTKYQVAALFRQIRKYVSYQAPMSPINISDDRHLFECPRCNVKFETEGDWTVDDFIFCSACGQKFREVEENEDES